MQDKQYKYTKYEKLSDAARAWEEGEVVFYKPSKLNKAKYLPIKPREETGYLALYAYNEYYRREEVKPLECWAIANSESEHLNIVSVGSEDFVKEYKITHYPEKNFKVIKMREVIE